MTACQVINHTPAGYALRQIDSAPCAAARRRSDRAAGRGPNGAAGGDGALVPQHAARYRPRIRLRAADRQSGAPPQARGEDADGAPLLPMVLLPDERSGRARRRWRWSRPAVFQLEQAISLRRDKSVGTAVLTKLVDQGPGFELFEYRRSRADRQRRAGGARRAASLVALALLEVLLGAVARAAEAGRVVARARRLLPLLALDAGVRAADACARGNGRCWCCPGMSPRASCARSAKAAGTRCAPVRRRALARRCARSRARLVSCARPRAASSGLTTESVRAARRRARPSPAAVGNIDRFDDAVELGAPARAELAAAVRSPAAPGLPAPRHRR